MSSTRRPDWQQVVLRKAHARATRVRTKQRYVDMGRIQMVVGGGYLTALSRAAQSRDISVTAYCRRAVAAFVAHDTAVPFAELLRDAPHPSGPKHGSFDPATGHGSWVIERFTDDTDVI